MATKIQQLKEIVGRFFAGQKTAGMQTEDINAKKIKTENIVEAETTEEKHGLKERKEIVKQMSAMQKLPKEHGLKEMKEIIKQMGAMQRMLKEHRKTKNFKGERQTVEFVTNKLECKNGKYIWTDQNVKIYLTSNNASLLLTSAFFQPGGTDAKFWGILEDKATDDQHIYSIGLVPVPSLSKDGDIMTFFSTTTMVANFNDAYALLRYERKTKKNDYLERFHKELDNGYYPRIKRIMDYFRDDVEKEG